MEYKIMAGTIEGGKKAAKKNKERYGSDFYKQLGKLGGSKSRGGGFTGDPERAREAGKKGVMIREQRRADRAKANYQEVK